MKSSVLGTSVAVILLAVTAAGQSGAQKVNGHLVDAVCAGNHATEPGYVEKHTRTAT